MARIELPSRRRLAWMISAAGLACGALAWHVGAQEFGAPGPIGEFYSHAPDEFPYDHLGDVRPEISVPRSAADTRVRQFDELDRPRFADRLTHRSAQVNSERFTVVALSGQADAQLALEHFSAAWDEFSRLADTFTTAHRNPDFAIGQLLIVIDNEPVRERDVPARPMTMQNGQTLVYINVSDGEPLEDRLGELHQGAVHALLHLAELDRKFPVWAQQGLAEYTADQLQQRTSAAATRQQAEDDEGFDPEPTPLDAEEPATDDAIATAEQDTTEPDLYNDSFDPSLGPQGSFGGVAPVAVEYWRLPRVVQDRLADPPEPEPSASFQRVKFLLEGDDGEHAPDFLLALAELAAEPTDPTLESRGQLANTQLLYEPEDTVVDELAYELEESFLAWRQDPLRGQPLFLPGGDIPDPAMLAREKQMELVLKLALRVERSATEAEIQPRITEFGADGQREVASAITTQAIDCERLFHQLRESELPWATIDAEGQLLLWTDDDRLAEVLGVEENRYRTEWREGHWVLVSDWDEETVLEAWLEPNENNPSRPLVKFTARPKASEVRVAELETLRR